MSENIIAFLACIFLILIFGRLFLVPLKHIFKIILNSILGAIILYIINLIGSLFNFYIGINIFTCLTVGLLGIPGVICMVLIRLIIGS